MSHNMLTFCRMTKNKKKCLLWHFNFSPVVYENHRIACLCPGVYREVFNSDNRQYGGSGLVNVKPVTAEKQAWDWNEYSMQVNVPAYGAIAFEFDYQVPAKPAKTKNTKVRRRDKNFYKKIKH